MDAETTNGLEINGKIYETPDPLAFTIDESQVLYDYAGLVVEDFIPMEDEDEDSHAGRIYEITKNPGFKKTLLHVAYQRANPKVPRAHVEKIVGGANWLAPFLSLVAEGEEDPDASPPASTSEPPEPSQKGSLENSNSSARSSENPGDDSTTSSDEQADQQQATTGLKSVTSSISPQEISAA